MNKLEKIITEAVKAEIPANKTFHRIYSLTPIYFNGEKSVVSVTRVIPENHDDVTTNFQKTFTLKELGGGSYLTKLWNEL